LVERIAAATALELRATGFNFSVAPCVAVSGHINARAFHCVLLFSIHIYITFGIAVGNVLTGYQRSKMGKML
jgi:beta-glucosidase-like glycosyl hydrolase